MTPCRAADRAALYAALTELAEQDPLIDLRRDDADIAVSLYGEVQKEVIAATLAEEYGIDGHVPRDDAGVHRAGRPASARPRR